MTIAIRKSLKSELMMYDFRDKKDGNKSKTPYTFWDFMTDFRFYIALIILIIIAFGQCSK